MWIFSDKKAIAELSARVDKLELTAKQLDMEWSSCYDKFRSILARIAKRSERHEGQFAAESQGADDTGIPSAPAIGPLSNLTARQRTLHDKILAARRKAQ